MDKFIETISTKVSKHGTGKQTVVTVDFTGATLDAIKAYALQAIRVKVQGRFRQDGIPSAYTFNVRDNPVGSKVSAPPTVESLHAQTQVMSHEERKALIAKLIAESDAREAEAEAEAELTEEELDEATKPK